jgi:hypothetical protein
VSVPTMNGWMLQWYGYEASVLNICLKLSPGKRVPELNVLPSSEVTVCEVVSLFVQQTVVPTGTVTSAGSKEKSWMLTIVSPASQTTVPAGLAGLADAWPAAGSTATNASNTNENPLLIPRSYDTPPPIGFLMGT